jgi:hypothetical protein
MKAAMIVFALGLFGLTLAGCSSVEGFYAARCADVGGTWDAGSGCTNVQY